MNYLAHLYLARHSEDAMLGAMLGDFVGSAGLAAYPAEVRREIRLHWKIDSFTDHHPAVREARWRFPEGRRRYAGILLDVYFDHLLARDWHRWHGGDLDAFNRRFYQLLRHRMPVLPERLKLLAPRIAEGDWLGAYRDRDTVDRAVDRIAGRLSRNADKLRECIPVLRRHEAETEAAFEAFFPDLVAYVAAQRADAG